MRRLALSLALFAACSGGTHHGVGTVTEVDPAHGQLMLAHEAIPGLMPAMTMNFDVADPALLSGLVPGDRVRFELSADDRSYRILAIRKVAGAPAGAPAASAGPGLGNVATTADAAPAFALTDQDGRAVALDALRGKAVVLDFVYTRCPGPCPILTSAKVEVQKALPDALRPHVHFVSVSLDPGNDTPEALRGYALARGADLGGWSFLTGDPPRVDAVLQSYGVSALREPGQEIQHVVVSFLIDPRGRIAKRYFGTDHAADEYLRDLSGVIGG